MNNYRLLIKYPSRERPLKFLTALRRCIELATDKDIQVLVSIDDDDATMKIEAMWESLKAHRNAIVRSGVSFDKVHAINRDMEGVNDWDIVVLMSDDMICQVQGWDDIIKKAMKENFPDTDGCLFYADGDKATAKHNNGQGLCTMVIMGRKYYDRFGYIYNPAYKSLWCDNEQTDVAFMLGKMYKSSQILFKHEHHSNNSQIIQDALMKRTQSFYTEDGNTYAKRKAKNFDLKLERV